jgi:hypothetical protein
VSGGATHSTTDFPRGEYGNRVSVQWTEDDTVKMIGGPALEVEGTPILANGDSWSKVGKLFGHPWKKGSYHDPSLVRGDLREEAAVYKTQKGVLLVIGGELEETGAASKFNTSAWDRPILRTDLNPCWALGNETLIPRRNFSQLPQLEPHCVPSGPTVKEESRQTPQQPHLVSFFHPMNGRQTHT